MGAIIQIRTHFYQAYASMDVCSHQVLNIMISRNCRVEFAEGSMLEKAKKLLRRQVYPNNIPNKTALGNVEPFFAVELADFLEVESAWILEAAREFRETPEAWRSLSQLRSPSKKSDGVAKSLDVAEGFALWCLVKRYRPRVIVELGVNLGVSARLWKEALRTYVQDHRLILCDLEDKRQLIGEKDAEFLLGDAHDTLSQVFSETQVDILFNDAHPYALIDWSVRQGLASGVPIFAFHDTGKSHPRGSYKPSSFTLSREEKFINSDNWGDCGTWERHVIAELFDQGALTSDSVTNKTWKIRTFDSFLGVSVVANKSQPAYD